MRASSEDHHESAARDVPPGAEAADDAGRTSPGDATSRARRLIPRRLDFLVRERPLLWYEDAAEYDALREEVFAEFMPEGAVEVILIKNLVDVLWEARRLRRLKEFAIHRAMPKVAAVHFVPGYEYDEKYVRRPRAEVVTRAATIGADVKLREGEKGFEEMMRERVLTPEMLHYETLCEDGDMLDRLDRRVERLESRFHQLLKQFEGRRERMAAMARRLMERERSQVVDAVAVVED